MINQLSNKLGIKNIEIIPTQTLPEDSQNIAYLNSIEPNNINEATYVVKIWFANNVPVTNISIDLLFNEYKVRKYFEFDGGIYFKVFNPRFFEKHSNKKIFFLVGNIELVETGWKFPSYETDFKNNIEISNEITLKNFIDIF